MGNCLIMETVVLTWRWQNILSIWVMIIGLFFALTLARQVKMRMDGQRAANSVGQENA